MRIPLVLLLATALLGGCAQPVDETPTAVPPTVMGGPGAVTAAVGAPGVASFRYGTPAVAFAVDDTVSLVLIELAWDSPLAALDLCVHAPSDGLDAAGNDRCGATGDGGGLGAPTNGVRHVVTAPERGAGWTAGVFSDGPALEQQYVLRVSLFHGEAEVPAGYTAL